MTPPYVIKTDGLAAGKGVLVTDDLAKAFLDVRAKLSGAAFGAAGARVIVEEGLEGEECSLFAICDGTNFVTLVPSQDFKRVGDKELGPNTGGMGSYAPMDLSAEQLEEITERIIKPTLAELKRRAIDYRGVLYAGLMVGPEGTKLLEYNVRFGDPETQVLAPLYGEKLYDLLFQASEGRLKPTSVTTSGAAVSVILASEGYPLRPTKGDVIRGLGNDGQLLERDENVIIFHAGTRQRVDGTFVTSGGRALSITGLGDNVAQARERAYRAAGLVTFRGMVQRSDIALVASRGDQ
jgi:phosphoribosylamine--glycine ligase